MRFKKFHSSVRH